LSEKRQSSCRWLKAILAMRAPSIRIVAGPEPTASLNGCSTSRRPLHSHRPHRALISIHPKRPPRRRRRQRLARLVSSVGFILEVWFTSACWRDDQFFCHVICGPVTFPVAVTEGNRN